MAIGVEERVARLEGQVMEQTNMMNAVLDSVRDFGSRMDQRFLAMDQRFVAIDQRFVTIDQRFAAIDLRFQALEARMDTRFLQVDDRFSQLDAKISRQFVWLVGLIVTILIAIVGTLGGVMSALVR